MIPAPGVRAFRRVRTPRPGLGSGRGLGLDSPSTIRHFEGDEHGNFEAVAYIDEKQAIAMLVLSARKKSDFERAYPAFEKLVGSYRFLTSDVKMEP